MRQHLDALGNFLTLLIRSADHIRHHADGIRARLQCLLHIQKHLAGMIQRLYLLLRRIIHLYHNAHRLLGILCQLSDNVVNLMRCICRLCRKTSDLFRNYRKSASGFSRARRLDRSIQGKQIRLICDLTDQRRRLADLIDGCIGTLRLCIHRLDIRLCLIVRIDQFTKLSERLIGILLHLIGIADQFFHLAGDLLDAFRDRHDTVGRFRRGSCLRRAVFRNLIDGNRNVSDGLLHRGEITSKRLQCIPQIC